MESLGNVVLMMNDSFAEFKALKPEQELLNAVSVEVEKVEKIVENLVSEQQIHAKINELIDEKKIKSLFSGLCQQLESHVLGLVPLLGQHIEHSCSQVYSLDDEVKSKLEAENKKLQNDLITKSELRENWMLLLDPLSEKVLKNTNSLLVDYTRKMRENIEKELVGYIHELVDNINATKEDLKENAKKQEPVLPPVPPPRSPQKPSTENLASNSSLNKQESRHAKNAELMANLNRMLANPAPAVPPKAPEPEIKSQPTELPHQDPSTNTAPPLPERTPVIPTPVHEEVKEDIPRHSQTEQESHQKEKKKKGLFGLFGKKDKSKNKSVEEDHVEQPQPVVEKPQNTVHVESKPAPPPRKPTGSNSELNSPKHTPQSENPSPSAQSPAVAPHPNKPVPPPRKTGLSVEMLDVAASEEHVESRQSPVASTPSPTRDRPPIPVPRKSEVAQSREPSPVRTAAPDLPDQTMLTQEPQAQTEEEVPKVKRIPGAVALPGHGAISALAFAVTGKPPMPSKARAMTESEDVVPPSATFRKESSGGRLESQGIEIPKSSSPEREVVAPSQSPPKKKEAALSGDDKTIEKVGLEWLNTHLQASEMKVESIYDISDGVSLLFALENCTNERVGRWNKKILLPVHRIDNLSVCLTFLKGKTVVVNATPADIANGDKASIVTLMYHVLRVFGSVEEQ